jgi:DNA-binding transcriptional LysR family regulator
MDTDQLDAFLGVAREGSFSRAAAALGLGQPAVSARIAALEAQLGGRLFARGRHIGLTPFGEAFLAHARRAREILDEGLAVARLAQTGRQGRVSLAALGSLAGGLVGPALSRFVTEHPGVEVAMRAGDHELVVAQLWDGVVELGLCTWPAREAVAADLTVLLHLREPVLLVAAPGHPLARRRGRKVATADLIRLGRPFLRLRWWQEHDPALEKLARAAGTPVTVPMGTARQLVRAGSAVGFFTRTYIADDLARGDLVELDAREVPRLQRDSALCRRARPEPLSPAAARLVEAIADEARRLGLLVRGRRLRAG